MQIRNRLVTVLLRGAVLAVAGAPLLGAPPAVADDEPNDAITAYHVEAEIHPDGTVSISESITYDFGDLPGRGIYREIPTSLDGAPAFHRRVVGLADIEVSSPSGADATIQAVEDRRDGDVAVDIGLPDDAAPAFTGEQTYVISYTVSGALTPHDGHDELYWNFVGTEWDIPIDDVAVTVTAPELAGVDCYAGRGGTDRRCVTAEHDGRQALLAQPWLARESGLTAAIALPPGTVTVAEPVYEVRREWRPTPLALGVVAAAVLAVAGLVGYNVRRRDASAREYGMTLPRWLRPGLAGLLTAHGTVEPRHLLAMIVDLEERGVLSSHPKPNTPGDWWFRLEVPLQQAKEAGAAYPERILLVRMFKHGTDTDLDRLARRMNPSTARRIQKAIWRQGVRRGLYAVRPTVQRWLVFLALAAAGVATLVTAPVAGANYVGWSLLVVALVFAVFVGMSGLSRYGRHVRRVLRLARVDTQRGGPLSLAERPALAAALGVNSVIEDAAGILPGSSGHHYPHRPFYYDDLYSSRWNRRMKSRMRPKSSSSGGSGGGGSVGGGGGGGGGGRR